MYLGGFKCGWEIIGLVKLNMLEFIFWKFLCLINLVKYFLIVGVGYWFFLSVIFNGFVLMYNWIVLFDFFVIIMDDI